jgi:hypothetical protein
MISEEKLEGKIFPSPEPWFGQKRKGDFFSLFLNTENNIFYQF